MCVCVYACVCVCVCVYRGGRRVRKGAYMKLIAYLGMSF